MYKNNQNNINTGRNKGLKYYNLLIGYWKVYYCYLFPTDSFRAGWPLVSVLY